jgi:hypothetical protein
LANWITAAMIRRQGRRPVIIAGECERVSSGGAFVESPLAVALEQEPPNVDLLITPRRQGVRPLSIKVYR